MKVTKAVDYFINYHKANSKKKYDQESGFCTNHLKTGSNFGDQTIPAYWLESRPYAQLQSFWRDQFILL